MSLTNFVKRLRDIMRNDAGINGDAQRIEQIAWMLFLKVYDAKEQDWNMDEDDYQSIIPEECRWINWAVDDKSGKAMTGDTLMNFVNNTLFPVLKGQDIKDTSGNVLIKGIVVTTDTPIKKSIVQTTFEDANNYMKDGVLLRQVINVIDELDLTDYEESHAFGEIYESILRELQSAGSSGEFYTPRAVTEFMAKMIQPKIGEKMADFACGTGGFITSWLNELAPLIQNTDDQSQYDNSIYGIEKKQFPYMLCITNMLLHGLDVPNIYHDNALLRDVLDYTEDDQFDVILMNPPFGGNEKNEVKKHFPSDLASSETADLFMAVIMYRLKKNGRAAVVLPDGFLFGTDNAKMSLKRKLLSEFNLHTVIRLPSSVFAPYTPKATNIIFFDNTHPTLETWVYRLDIPTGYKHFSKLKPIKYEHFSPVTEWWNNRQNIQVDGFDKAKKYTIDDIVKLDYKIDTCCQYPKIEEEIYEPSELITRYQSERQNLSRTIDDIVKGISNSLENPGAIQTESVNINSVIKRLIGLNTDFPEKLRKSILQQAMEGKLTMSESLDEPVSKLLMRIEAERTALIKSGVIRKSKTDAIIVNDDLPFDIPETWTWSTLDIITYPVGNKNNQILTKDVQPQGEFPVVSQSQNLIDGYSSEGEKAIFDLPLVMFGDHTRNVKYIDFPFVIGADGTKFHKCIEVNPRYIYYWMQYASGVIRNRGYARHYSLLKEQYIPLPPYKEQSRIVERLDSLLEGLNV